MILNQQRRAKLTCIGGTNRMSRQQIDGPRTDGHRVGYLVPTLGKRS